MLESYSHPMMYVNDLNRAVNWYTENLGFEVHYHAPGAYASLYNKKMKFRLDLHPTEADAKDVGYGCINYFASKNIEETIGDLKNKGIKVGEVRKEGESPRFVTFWDSEGNALGIEELK